MKMHISRVLTIIVVCAWVAACHDSHRGNSMTTPPPPSDPTAAVPDSASSSIDGFITYLKSLVTAAADMLEPVDVSKVTPKTDETSEPTPVN